MIDWLRALAKGGEPGPEITLSGRRLPIELSRHARAVCITLPRWCRSQDAIAFAQVRKPWLEDQLAKLPPPVDPLARGTLRYRGTELAIDWRSAAPRRPVLNQDGLCLGGPRETLRRRLQRWLEGEAQRLMASDLAEYCAAAGLPVPAFRLSRAGRRWGSCSTKGIVRVNWRLVMAPDAVRRSVVAHEVTHLVHFDHSLAFHSLLASLYEGAVDEADRWLRAHGRELYAEFG
jgi:predicted metal-dependent hydrolase